MIKVTEVEEMVSKRITINNNDECIRYGPSAWYKCYGSSDEFIYDDSEVSELEAAYQEYIVNNG